jgi:hypothetical protein
LGKTLIDNLIRFATIASYAGGWRFGMYGEIAHGIVRGAMVFGSAAT